MTKEILRTKSHEGEKRGRPGGRGSLFRRCLAIFILLDAVFSAFGLFAAPTHATAFNALPVQAFSWLGVDIIGIFNPGLMIILR